MLHRNSEFADLTDVVIGSESFKTNCILNSLVMTNAFMPLSGKRSENFELLKYLESVDAAYYTYATSELKVFDSVFEVINKVLGLTGLVMFIFSALLIYSFISSSVSSKKKDIGILRSIGASGKDVARIFLFEAAVICGLNIVLTCVLTATGIAILNAALTQSFVTPLTVLTFNPLSYLYSVLLNVLITFAASAIPLLKITRMRPIDAVKEK